MPDIEYDES